MKEGCSMGTFKYSRLATEEDFRGYKVEYDHYREMNDDVKELIEQDKFNEATKLFSQGNGLGVMVARKYCLEYQRYVFAKRDFENGKMVFVSY
jgi:hypothetical protein